MTDRKQALTDLLEKVEAGGWNGFLTHSAFDYMDDDHAAMRSKNAYYSSLDAAKALHEAVLHEACEVNITWSLRYGAIVTIDHRMKRLGRGEGGSLALAWLIAILKALIAKEDERC